MTLREKRPVSGFSMNNAVWRLSALVATARKSGRDLLTGRYSCRISTKHWERISFYIVLRRHSRNIAMRFPFFHYFVPVFLAINSSVFSQTPTEHIRVSGDSMILISQEDDFNIPFVHFVFLAQYYHNNAHGVRAGDITILKDSAGMNISKRIKYDHPLSCMSETPLLPYYADSVGANVANAVLSDIFTLGAFDTLVFYREATTRRPAEDDNGTAFIPDTNTAASMPDSCLFISELISDDGASIVQAVDTVEYKHSPPTYRVKDFVNYNCDSTDPYACFRIRTVSNNPFYIGLPIKLRIRPEFHFIESQSDTDRCILALFNWSRSALSAYYRYFSGDTIDKKHNALLNAIIVKNMKISPSSIRGPSDANMIIHIHGARGPAQLSIYQQTGQIIDKHTLHFNNGSAAFLFNSGNYPAGIFHFIVKTDNTYYYSKISLIK